MHTNDFAEVLVTKLCHDLAGPISAVANGLELIDAGSEHTQVKAAQLVRQSSAEIVARLCFFRCAYGIAQPIGAVDFAELQPIIGAMYNGTKIQIEWQHDTHAVLLTQHSARLLLNLLLIVAGSLIHGGSIAITITMVGDQKILRLVGSSTGKSIKKLQHALPILCAQTTQDSLAEPISVSNVQLYLTQNLLTQLRTILQVKETDNTLELLAALPSNR